VTAATDASVAAAQRVRELRLRIEGAAEADADRIGRAAIPELEKLMTSLSGSQLHEARYALLSAYFGTEDEKGICATSALVLDNPFNGDARVLASTLRSQYGCQ
jgi:hypothetical protein